MCRISGFWDFNFRGDYDIEKTSISMRDSLAYGGPDDAGVYTERERGLSIAHRRLSIIDLSSLGHQPMANEEKDIWITYNGEVYNFQEIKKELSEKGCYFKSNTDTEIVLKAYQYWGFEAVHKFRGMFAFALWDKRAEKLILCRDRAGVKPLYWYYKDGLFMFASELKAFHQHPKFHKELDKRALASFLTFGNVPSYNAIFKCTYKLEPGHYLSIDKKGNIEKFKYWDIKDYYLKGESLKKERAWAKKPEEEVIEEMECILTESFKLRMIADVPVGVFLSGGIDSTLLTCLLSKAGFKLKTFTIGFHESEYNEAGYAAKIADYCGADHTQFYCTPKDAFEVITKLPSLFDEPFGDSSAIPTHLVSLLAKQKVKVSLSADGGDELFCGYDWYQVVNNRAKRIFKLPFRRQIKAILEHIPADLFTAMYNNLNFILPRYSNTKDKFMKFIEMLQFNNVEDIYRVGCSFFIDKEIEKLTLPRPYNWNIDMPECVSLDNLHKLMCIDFKAYLADDILAKVDRASMSVALEAREPLLDHKIIEYAAALPIDYKYRNGTAKYILKKILKKHLPEKLYERKKQGFAVPIQLWLKKDLKPLFNEYLNEQRIKKEGILDAKAVNILLEDYLKDRGVNAHKLWFLLMFEMWKEKWCN